MLFTFMLIVFFFPFFQIRWISLWLQDVVADCDHYGYRTTCKECHLWHLPSYGNCAATCGEYEDCQPWYYCRHMEQVVVILHVKNVKFEIIATIWKLCCYMWRIWRLSTLIFLPPYGAGCGDPTCKECHLWHYCHHMEVVLLHVENVNVTRITFSTKVHLSFHTPSCVQQWIFELKPNINGGTSIIGHFAS